MDSLASSIADSEPNILELFQDALKAEGFDGEVTHTTSNPHDKPTLFT